MRWSDMDAYGHVNNVVYLTYLEEARVDMLFVHEPIHRAGRLASGVVVARHEIDYKRPIVFRPEPLRIETWVSRIGNASFTLGHEVVDDTPDGKRLLYARAASVLVPYDTAEDRPRRVTQEERAVLEQFLDPVPV